MADPIETVESDAAQQPPSTPTPAITAPTPVDVDALKARAKEEARREAQSAKDREIASLHQQYQARERALRAKARTRLARHDEGEAAQLDSELENESVIEQARAIVQRETATQESRRTANEIADVFGLRGDDPRLLNATDWTDFRTKAKAAAADDARKEREAAKQAEEVKARKVVDQRVDSGELSALDIKPSGASRQNAETLVEQLQILQRNPTKNSEKIRTLTKELEELSK